MKYLCLIKRQAHWLYSITYWYPVTFKCGWYSQGSISSMLFFNPSFAYVKQNSRSKLCKSLVNLSPCYLVINSNISFFDSVHSHNESSKRHKNGYETSDDQNNDDWHAAGDSKDLEIVRWSWRWRFFIGFLDVWKFWNLFLFQKTINHWTGGFENWTFKLQNNFGTV